MSTRVTVLVGVLAGAVAAAVVLAVAIALGPDPAPPRTPRPILPSAASPTPRPAAPSSSAPVAATASAGASGASPGNAAFHIGETAPPLAVPQVGGGTIDLAALRGQPVWVNFMATWCPPCIDEFPVMNGFAARYADDGLTVVAIDVGEDEGTVAAFVERLGATFPVGLDADGRAQDAWDAIALPVHFWIDAQGVVRDGALGGIGPDVMAAGLGAIMPGVEVTP
jgi:thiol-disulfide isomerase/thioredoxin